MNLDERLEALTQSVELLAAMHKDNEKTHKENEKIAREMMLKIDERVGALRESVELLASIHTDNERQNAEALRQNEQIHGEMMLAIVRL